MAKDGWRFSWVLNESTDKYHIGLVREALLALGDGVRRCSERIDEAHASGNEDYAEIVTDEECDVVETLLGSAFTVCQTHIARVVSHVRSLHHMADRPFDGKAGVQLNTTSLSKLHIMRHGCPFVATSNVTVIEALNALANYFKHHDEWATDWTKATGQAVETIRVIQEIGLKERSTGNLRSGAEALGNPDYDNMGAFINILEEWHEQLMADYEGEIRSKGLIS